MLVQSDIFLSCHCNFGIIPFYAIVVQLNYEIVVKILFCPCHFLLPSMSYTTHTHTQGVAVAAATGLLHKVVVAGLLLVDFTRDLARPASAPPGSNTFNVVDLSIYLCDKDEIESKSTPSQEGEYDEDIMSSHIQDSSNIHGPMTRAHAH